MNERRQWDSKTKAKIVLEGLKGRSVVEICTEYAISQSMYYKWSAIFLANIDQPVEIVTPILGMQEDMGIFTV